jgi:hypothetical protein
VETLARANEAYLLDHPRTPALYKSGVRYQREERPNDEPERWQGIAEIIREGHGDCEDLAAWLIAQIRNRGGIALPHVVQSRPGRDGRWHIMVKALKREKWVLLDPSRKLGM